MASSDPDNPAPATGHTDPAAPPHPIHQRRGRQQQRRRRSLAAMVARDVLVPVLVVAGALAGLWHSRAPLVEAAAGWTLERAGWGPAALTVETLTTDRLIVTDVTLGDGTLTASRLTASYTLAGLARGQLDRVEVAGPAVTAAWTPDDGLTAGPLTALFGAGPAEGRGAPVPALPVRALILSDARLSLATPEGTARVLGDIRVDTEGAEAEGAEPSLSADLTASAAEVFATATVRGRPWPTPALRADLSVEARPRTLPGGIEGVEGQGTFTLDWRNDRLRMTTHDLSVRAEALPPALARTLRPVLGAPAEGPVTLSLADTGTAPPARAVLHPPSEKDDAWRLDGAAALAVEDGAGHRVTLSGTINARRAAESGALSGTLSDVLVAATGLSPMGLSGARVELASPRLTLAGGGISGPVRVRAEAAGVDRPGLVADRIGLAASATITANANGGTAVLGNGVLTLARPRAPDGSWTGPDPLTLTLAPDQPQTLALDLSVADAQAVTANLAFGPLPLTGTVMGHVESLHLAGRWPPTAAHPLVARATLPRARVGDWSVSDARATMTLGVDGPTVTLAGAVPNLPGEASSEPPRGHPLRPLLLDGRIAPDPDHADRLSVILSVDAPTHATLAHLQGWIAGDGAAGNLRLSGKPLALGTDGVQPWHLHEALKDLSASAGSLAVSGPIAWTDGGPPTPDLSIGLADVEAAYGTTRLRGLHGVIRLTGLRPHPRTPPGQELVAAGLDMGLPFSALSLRFHLDGREGAFVLEEARMSLAGGEISVGPATIPLSGFDRVPLTLTVSGLELDALAAMTPIDGLEVSGQVDGTVPMVITPGAVRIDAGRLAAVAPGVLRYQGAALPEGMQGVDLARRALEDFRYSDLSMTVDGGTEEDMRVGLRLEGANDSVLNGHPFQLNVSLTGPLTRLIQEGLQGTRIPNRILERLQTLGLSADQP